MTAVTEHDRLGGDELRKLERIRQAALKSFATQGRLGDVPAFGGGGCRRFARIGAASLRNKVRPDQGRRRLRDERGDRRGRAAASRRRTRRTRSPTWAAGSPHFSSSIPTSWTTSGARSSTAASSATTIWDTLSAFGTARWTARKENGEARDDIDVTWASLNSLVLAAGHPQSCARHIERRSPAPSRRPNSSTGGSSPSTRCCARDCSSSHATTRLRAARRSLACNPFAVGARCLSAELGERASE